jgi:hypothetical protein
MKVTSRAQIALVKSNSVSHVVDVDDTSQDPAGSSYKATEAQRFNGRGLAVQNNLIAAIAAPVVGDDSSLGYSKGSNWFFAGILYVCQSAAVGAAVWKPFSESISGVYTPTVSDILNGSTVTISDIAFQKIGNNVQFSGTGRVDFDGAVYSESFQIDLDLLIEPSANFAANTSAYGGVVPFTGFTFNPGGLLEAVAGTKKILFNIETDTAGLTVKFYFQGNYSVA